MKKTNWKKLAIPGVVVMLLITCNKASSTTEVINPPIETTYNEKTQYISYSYGSTWANWKTAWHPLNFKP